MAQAETFGPRGGTATPAARALPVQASPRLGLTILFMITVLMPISFELGGLLLTPTRLFLLIAVLPFAAQILTGQVGRFTIVDLFFLLHGVWIFLSLSVVHGASRIPFAGITMVELVGGYFVGRVLIRDAADYRMLFRVVLISLICLMPAAIYENITGKLVIPDLLRPVFDTPARGNSAYGRLGLERVYGVFEHPILWGLFCSLLLANLVMTVRDSAPKIVLVIGFTLYATMLSLSSAPLLSCALQIGLLSWAWMVGGRWKTLIIGMASAYILLDLASDRTPVTIIIETLTFNPMSGWVRMAINRYGWDAAVGSPIFGIGFNDWPRPGWVTRSVDNFWLVNAMRYGIVGAGFLVAAFVAHLWLAARAQITDRDVAALRIGHAIALAGVGFTLITVHMWGSVAVFVVFYLGAGAWIYTADHSAPADDAAAPPPDPDAAPPSRYTRFPAAAPRSRA